MLKRLKVFIFFIILVVVLLIFVKMSENDYDFEKYCNETYYRNKSSCIRALEHFYEKYGKKNISFIVPLPPEDEEKYGSWLIKVYGEVEIYRIYENGTVIKE